MRTGAWDVSISSQKGLSDGTRVPEGNPETLIVNFNLGNVDFKVLFFFSDTQQEPMTRRAGIQLSTDRDPWLSSQAS